jgi:hypothetical protein
MARFEGSFNPPSRGVATSFGEALITKDYALDFINVYIDGDGAVRKRGGSTVIVSAAGTNASRTFVFEFIDQSGDRKLFSADTDTIFLKDAGANTESQVFEFDTPVNQGPRAVSMGGKAIFYNGEDRPVFTTDGSSFSELTGIIERETAAGAVSAGGVDSSAVADWVLDSNVQVNDLVYNATKNAYAVITAVVTSHIEHTTIGTTGTGLGQATENQITGDRFEIIDLVELNIVPTDTTDDNTGTGGSGTNATTIRVSGVNFSAKAVKKGDYVRNTTRSAIAKVSSVGTSALTVTSVAGQTTNDSLVFLRQAMPVIDVAHVHEMRGYFLDARDRKRIIVTGRNNPEDVTTNSLSLDSSSILMGNFADEDEEFVAITSYQRLLAVGGQKNIFLFSGRNPIVDTTADSEGFVLTGIFPQGVINKDCLISIGDDAVFVSPDGIQTISQISDSSDLNRSNISEQIKDTLREDIARKASDVSLFHYPKKSWVVVHGINFDNVSTDAAAIFNYSALIQSGRRNRPSILDPKEGGWSIFRYPDNGTEPNHIIRLTKGTAVAATGEGLVKWDDDSVYKDGLAGASIPTKFKTHRMDFTGSTRPSTRQKQGLYFRPLWEVANNETFRVTFQSDYDTATSATQTITVSASSTVISDKKYPVRWRGRNVTMTIETSSSTGPFLLSRHTHYGTVWGVR